MARVRILKWLYKHSPVNFYSVSDNGETIIKSINNTSVGYKFGKILSKEDIEAARKVIKRYKRLTTVAILFSYFLLLYFVIFPNYAFFTKNIPSAILTAGIIILILISILYGNAKFFEKYLKKQFGDFEKTHFPSSNSIENQSYKDFKLELAKIFTFVILVCGAYFLIGSPYETSMGLIQRGQYKDAIKMTTIWSAILPIEPQWYTMRAYAKFQTGDYQGAINDYDKAYQLEEDEFKMMNFDNKIYIKYFIKDYKSALKDFDTEIENNDDPYIKDAFLWDKAQFLYNIGEYSKSLAIYNQLIVNAENDSIYLIKNRLYYERAQVNRMQGNDSQANKDILTAINLELEETFRNPIPKPTLLMDSFN